MTKTCKHCHETKPIEQFDKNGNMGDGHLNRCKPCESAIRKSRYVPKTINASKRAKDGFKLCVKCEQVLPVTEFGPATNTKDGLIGRCYECDRAYRRERYHKDIETSRAKIRAAQKANPHYKRNSRAKYNAAKLKRMPIWADQDRIKAIYDACPKGWEVDHIYPLQGDLVSGLHVPNNLQYMPRSENAQKRNKFVPKFIPNWKGTNNYWG